MDGDAIESRVIATLDGLGVLRPTADPHASDYIEGMVELIEQLFTYSDPKRDPRKHTISTVYACKVRGGSLEAADDAQDAGWYAESEIPWKELCFDHAEILRDYFHWSRTGQRRKV